jgi:hypothetical protein
VIQEHHGGTVRIKNESIGAAFFSHLKWDGNRNGAVVMVEPR